MLINLIIKSLLGVFVCDIQEAFFIAFNLTDGNTLD